MAQDSAPDVGEKTPEEMRELIISLNRATEEARKACAEANLTPAAKDAIRGYMLNFLLPSAAAGAILGWLCASAANIVVNKGLEERTDRFLDRANDDLLKAKNLADTVKETVLAIKDRASAQSATSEELNKSLQLTKREAENTLKGMQSDLANAVAKLPNIQELLRTVGNTEFAKLNAQFERNQILAAGLVRNGQLSINIGFTNYDPNSRRLTFDNPKNMKFIPLISTVAGVDTYVTTTCFVMDVGPSFISIGEKVLDAGSRIEQPRQCAVAILGIGS